jgi:hypothetical protein
MTSDEALQAVKGFARANRIFLTTHAHVRMAERGARYADVQHALANAARVKNDGAPDKWKAFGEDLDGDELVCVVVIEDGLAVVTLY